MRKIFVVRSHTHRTNPAEVVRALNGNTGAITALRSLMGKYVTVASDNADPGFTRKAGSTLKMIFMIIYEVVSNAPPDAAKFCSRNLLNGTLEAAVGLNQVVNSSNEHLCALREALSRWWARAPRVA